MPGSPRTYLCFSWKPVCNIKLLKIKSQFKCTVGAGYLEQPAGEFSWKVNNHPRFICFMTLDFCVSCSHQARHTLISSFPTVASLCWVSGLKGLCHDRHLSLEGFWSAQAPVRLNPLPQLPGFPRCWRSKWKLHLLCFIYFRMKFFMTRVAFHLERWSTEIIQVVCALHKTEDKCTCRTCIDREGRRFTYLTHVHWAQVTFQVLCNFFWEIKKWIRLSLWPHSRSSSSKLCWMVQCRSEVVSS